MTNDNDSVEVMQTEEARKEKPIEPEWIRNPGVHVIIIPRGRVVAHYGGAFLVVIIINVRRFGVRRACRRLVFSIIPRGICHDR
jgi:hypothetical protein